MHNTQHTTHTPLIVNVSTSWLHVVQPATGEGRLAAGTGTVAAVLKRAARSLRAHFIAHQQQHHHRRHRNFWLLHAASRAWHEHSAALQGSYGE